MAKRSSPSILKHRRDEVEARIEELISLLDLLDGDCDLEENGDLEPSLGGSARSLKGKLEYDLEDAQADEYGIADMDALNLAMQEGFCRTLSDLGYEFDGEGHKIAERMIRGLPAAADRAEAYIDAVPIPTLRLSRIS